MYCGCLWSSHTMFSSTHARCCSIPNHPRVSGCPHSLCKTEGFTWTPFPNAFALCGSTVLVLQPFKHCSFKSSWHYKGKKRGAMLMVIQMCSSPYLLKSEALSFRYVVIVHNVEHVSYWHGKLVENWVGRAVIELTKGKSCKRIERIHQRGWAAATPEVTQDISKWPEGRRWNLLSPSKDQKPSFFFLTDVTFPLKFL